MAVEGGRLSLAWRDLSDIHPQIVDKFAAAVRELDLSNNNITCVDVDVDDVDVDDVVVVVVVVLCCDV
jgi:hypothetical protein